MDDSALGVLRGIATLAAMLGFIAVCAWAWSRRRIGRFEEAARLPLEEDQP